MDTNDRTVQPAGHAVPPLWAWSALAARTRLACAKDVRIEEHRDGNHGCETVRVEEPTAKRGGLFLGISKSECHPTHSSHCNQAFSARDAACMERSARRTQLQFSNGRRRCMTLLAGGATRLYSPLNGGAGANNLCQVDGTLGCASQAIQPSQQPGQQRPRQRQPNRGDDQQLCSTARDKDLHLTSGYHSSRPPFPLANTDPPWPLFCPLRAWSSHVTETGPGST